ncbi:hypothetical protein EDD95_1754 [Streptomyces sp. CEV 2-1]|uniref:DUF4034 domain-containing protein n=1 Tax=Streptomyces sp. CEV 2-1 TaxID=2485153 RepID=UPI000F4615BC|nr:DUF4034 domain-containing protein [Streptomyces sp. CEV 2-1]ROQ82148.1 hypothetical protein EDD95_1754 [Streptomyces sp. CEV 2-1]
MRLAFLLAFLRVVRHRDAIGTDLAPDEAVALDAPDAPLRAAVAAAVAGDHAPARELLASTRTHAQWERRDACVSRLARTALHHDGWLENWTQESPGDPDAILVVADFQLHQAWEIRTDAGAEDVERDRFQAFFALLEDAVPVIGAAAELNPADPVPWRIALTHARSIQAPREVFDAYLAEARARDPHHFGCHEQALEYLCATWYGSHEEMFRYAERVADSAPPGSKLHALPLRAALEYRLAEQDEPDGPDGPDPYGPETEAALARALGLSGSYAAGDPEAAGFRNELALLLIMADRPAEALDAFRAIGVHATEFPWARLGDPLTEFLDARSDVRLDLASQIPLFGRPPEPPTGTPDWAELAPRAVAIVPAPPAEVAQAALLCGYSLRTAPAGEGSSYVEVVPEAVRSRRAALLPEEPLTSAAETFTTGESWPALVLHRAPGRSSITALHQGKLLAAHTWLTESPAPDHAEVRVTAQSLAQLYRRADPRPLAHILRATGDPAGHQEDLVKALGLPPVPPGFGGETQVLGELPGARVLARRGLLAGMRDTMSTGGSGHPPEPRPPRTPRWLLVRALMLLVLAAAATLAWWSPQIGWVRSSLLSIAVLHVAVRLRGAVRRRRRPTA